jgi:hypothetical protein
MPKTERNIFAAALVSVVGPQYNADMPSRGWVPKNEPTGNPVPYHLSRHQREERILSPQ